MHNLQLIGEIWLPISGFNGRYEVSNLGRFKTNRYKGRDVVKIMTTSNDSDGYQIITLLGKTFKAHRLVALQFINNNEDHPQVNHIDGDKRNNKASNLEWCTAKQNVMHSHKTGLKIPTRGSDCSWSILNESTVKEILLKHSLRMKQRDIATLYGVSYKLVNSVIKRRIWKHVTTEHSHIDPPSSQQS